MWPFGSEELKSHSMLEGSVAVSPSVHIHNVQTKGRQCNSMLEMLLFLANSGHCKILTCSKRHCLDARVPALLITNAENVPC